MASLNQGTVNMWALCVTKDKSKSITSSDGNILRYLYGGKIKRLDHDAVDIASTVISAYACGTSLFFFFSCLSKPSLAPTAAGNRCDVVSRRSYSTKKSCCG